MSKKLALGTVQFGLNYGINNANGIPQANEVRKIFTVAAASGITTLDTAEGYGDAERLIPQLSSHTFDIVSKFSRTESKNDLFLKLSGSLQRLERGSLYGYMAHNADNLFDTPSLWKALEEAKEKKQVERIGYSLYSPEQLEKLLELGMHPDLVQFPYNLLDRRFESYLAQLKRTGTEIHVRSVFLQGLYFMEPRNLPNKLKPLSAPLSALLHLASKHGKSIGSLALNFALLNKNIDRVVIGVDNCSQLSENLALVSSWDDATGVVDEVKNIVTDHPQLLNPSTW